MCNLNGYEYPFGSITEPNFASIMSVAATPERRLYFSNPEVAVDGVITGTPGKDNVRIIDELSPVMSSFRTRPDLIFVGGFE